MPRAVEACALEDRHNSMLLSALRRENKDRAAETIVLKQLDGARLGDRRGKRDADQADTAAEIPAKRHRDGKRRARHERREIHHDLKQLTNE